MIITQITELAKIFMAECIQKGDVVVDATLGNGNDAWFLRQLVGEEGFVYAFDIQETALEKSKKLIPAEAQSNMQFIQDSHAHMDQHIKQKVKAIVFNLGYLPQSDHQVKTSWPSTKIAIEKSLELLQEGGLLFLAAYLGHDEGEEYSRLSQMLRELDPKKYKVIEINPLNQNKLAPKLLVCQKV